MFWKLDKRPSFLRAVNERMDMDPDSKKILTYLEKRGITIMGGYSWDSSLSTEFLAYVKKQNQDEKLNLRYEFKKGSHLLRLVRNTVSHYSQLPGNIKFPHMLIEVYVAVLKYYNKEETVFQKKD
ncbi:unnamed protein product [Arabis nemorensis]|uniref:KEN domain-containing protein n=1 Tax=Arabis nemorensis TaxID=586526 RepID=A0A565C6M0_9BRAS|nr:unnamed protein product [Arabis nemorensis]